MLAALALFLTYPALQEGWRVLVDETCMGRGRFTPRACRIDYRLRPCVPSCLALRCSDPGVASPGRRRREWRSPAAAVRGSLAGGSDGAGRRGDAWSKKPACAAGWGRSRRRFRRRRGFPLSAGPASPPPIGAACARAVVLTAARVALSRRRCTNRRRSPAIWNRVYR